jgi:hypothetical protein
MTSAGRGVRSGPMRRIAVLSLLGAFLALALISIALFALMALIEGAGVEVILSPAAWLARLEPDAAADMLFSVAELVAGVLAIAITVSAIVVELAATRYNHRITWLFVREPVNVAIMSLFVVTTIQCVWVATTRDAVGVGPVPNAAFAITMTLVTLCLVVLLPYFAFVFAFLSPLSIIEKIRGRAYRFVERAVRSGTPTAKSNVEEAVDELQDVARSASEQSDRGIAMACVNALRDLLIDYQAIRDRLPPSWFTVDGKVAEDPDFVSLAPGVVEKIERDRLWLEVKIMRQYLSLMAHSVPDAREVANLIAINTARIGGEQGTGNPALLALCIQCFNSYLRTSINAGDARTSYYVMNQYRMLAEVLMAQQFDEPVREIAGHLKLYGQIAHQRGQSFLLQTAAGDLTTLVEASLAHRPSLVDDLLAIVLEVDQEIRSETQEESLLGVRRAQLQLATLFALHGDEERAKRICRDLAGERISRLERLHRELEGETREQYWEFTDRGTNFGYLPPERRAQLATVLQWVRSVA